MSAEGIDFSAAMTKKKSSQKGVTAAWIAISAIAAVMLYGRITIYMGIASFSFFLLTLGLILKDTPKVHSKLMTAGITLDILLVLVLELQRGAVIKAMGILNLMGDGKSERVLSDIAEALLSAGYPLKALQGMHIGVSTLATVLYFPILWIGYQLLKKSLEPVGRKALVQKHRKFAIPAYLLRAAGFILMSSF